MVTFASSDTSAQMTAVPSVLTSTQLFGQSRTNRHSAGLGLHIAPSICTPLVGHAPAVGAVAAGLCVYLRL
jgi:hypothetical protein